MYWDDKTTNLFENAVDKLVRVLSFSINEVFGFSLKSLTTKKM